MFTSNYNPYTTKPKPCYGIPRIFAQPFVWETPVRVDGSAALWREAHLPPARQAPQVFSTKKLNCNVLGGELEFPLPSFPGVTRTTPLWEEPLVASLHWAKTLLLYLEDHL